jgi:hypothetical protein
VLRVAGVAGPPFRRGRSLHTPLLFICASTLQYSWPNGPDPSGQHLHGTRKHGPRIAQHVAHHASAMLVPGPVPCLGCIRGTWH